MVKFSKSKMSKKRAQGWATDVLIGAGIFIVGVMLFFYIVDKKSKTDNAGEILSEANNLAITVATSQSDPNNPCAFIVGNKVDKNKLQQCAQDYPQSKSLLGMKKDFCIYFVDPQGNLLNISSLTNNEGIGLGSSDINYTLIDDNGDPVQVMPCRTIPVQPPTSPPDLPPIN